MFYLGLLTFLLCFGGVDVGFLQGCCRVDGFLQACREYDFFLICFLRGCWRLCIV